jgi:hypothetical protein
MRPIKFRLAVLAVGITALTHAPSASAESTALCKADEQSCTEANRVFHVHETSVGKAKFLTSVNPNLIHHVHEVTLSGKKARLLTSIGTVECDALYLGDVSNSKLEISGAFTYTNCILGGANCSIAEENGPSKVTVAGEGHETAVVTKENLVYVVCGSSIDCRFHGTGLLGTAKGSLLSAQKNGEVVLLGQSVSKEAGGFLCPKETKLDMTTTPLEATYFAQPTEATIELCKKDVGAKACPFETEGIIIECDALFLSNAIGTLASPLIIEGNFTYSNCNHECRVIEENGPSEIKVEKTGAEMAKVTGEGLVHLMCPGLVNCSYNGITLIGTGKGFLIATNTNGEVVLSEQKTAKEAGGFLCPKESQLDITTTPLTATYITS